MRPTIPLGELIVYLFGADDSALAAEVGGWLASSPRFRAFAETYRDKIRKKARVLREDEARRDLAFELAIAVRLVEERRFAVEYESYGMGQRAPDFRVTFRSGIRFNVEVRRLRGREPTGTPADSARITRAVIDKLGQLPPSMINVLVLGSDGPALAADALAPTMLGLQDRAARRDEVFFQRHGFAGSRDFLRHYQRLSGALWLGGEPGAARASRWPNPQARHPLPADLARALTNAVV
ncbi:MAG: hypothetical protein AUI15_07210 [Actinobacteria bacterium 13_2_20CM_2_66_6]|nr:MAG: hypothetical protein AUI15_07210 [Actinobacteria bacterium 13_2_20CM_2_66_6]